MPTVSIARSDLFPVGTTVGIYPAGSQRGGQTPAGGPPTSAVIATGVVDAAGNLSVTNAGILSYTPYVAYALVNGEHRYARLRSTLDTFDGGVATFTADTASGAATLLNASVSVGAIAIGQRVEGVGIPAGTYIISGSGASWIMSDKATANGTGVTLRGHGASPSVTGGGQGVGATPQPPTQSTRWRARVMQRRATAGTS
jgi:hypothetical protein